jgi:hypothetical protein
MKKHSVIVCLLGVLLVSTDCFAYIVVAKETVNTVVGRNKIDRGRGEYEVHYEVDEENKTVLRKEVNNFRRGRRIEDNTSYQIVENGKDISSGQKVIKAIGKPEKGAMELLIIGRDFVLSCRTTEDYVVIGDMKRLNVERRAK